MPAHAQPGDEHKLPTLRRVILLALLLGAATSGTLLLNTRTDGITVLWPSNGLLLGVLLLAPRRHWLSYFALGFSVDFAISSATAGFNVEQICLSICNMIEVLLAATALSMVLPSTPDFTRIRQLLQLIFFGAILAPAIATLLACSVVTYFGGAGILVAYRSWFVADSLGVATMTPLYLALARREFPASRTRGETLGIFGLIVVSTVAIFGQNRYPFLFLIPPLLLLAGVRLGLLGASLGLVIVSIIGGYLTSLGRGPMLLVPHSTAAQHILVFQFFIASTMFLLYGAEVLIRRNSLLQQAVAASEARFRLMTEASKDIILLSELNGRRTYVSPSVTEVLGWLPEELIELTDREIVHPDDLHLVLNLFEECRKGHASQAVSYRCRKPDGSYLWIEANVRLYLDPKSNEPTGLVSAMRDISGRKAAEERLQAAYDAVEALSTIDSLTGVANRRRMDEVLTLEWRRAVRDRTCLSLLMLDVDCFKSYNDIYGHMPGDYCLRQIADASVEGAQRPGDLVARFGGEEFVVILPNTDEEGSREIAESIRVKVQQRGIAHQGNQHGCVTVSIGCATSRPPHDKCDQTGLIEAADRALYQAKRGGRNQVCAAELPETQPAGQIASTS
jgi:diguanylate cyclase (GGDEF)-like protein/PAS domain S-box-containing protein